MRIFLSVLIGVFVWLLPPSICTADMAVALFTETFESESFSQWDSAGTNWSTIQQGVGNGVQHSAYFKGQSPVPIVNSSLIKSISTAGYTDIELSYYFRVSKGLESSDHLVTEWSLDGLAWSMLEDVTSTVSFTEWATRSFSILGAEDQSGFMFRFRGTMDAANDEIRFDSIRLEGTLDVVATASSDEMVISRRASFGTLGIEQRIQGGTSLFGDFTLMLEGGVDRFNADGRNEYVRPAGAYVISVIAPTGYTSTYGGACDEHGLVDIIGDDTVTCVITSTADPDTTSDLTIVSIPVETSQPTPTLIPVAPVVAQAPTYVARAKVPLVAPPIASKSDDGSSTLTAAASEGLPDRHIVLYGTIGLGGVVFSSLLLRRKIFRASIPQ